MTCTRGRHVLLPLLQHAHVCTMFYYHCYNMRTWAPCLLPLLQHAHVGTMSYYHYYNMRTCAPCFITVVTTCARVHHVLLPLLQHAHVCTMFYYHCYIVSPHSDMSQIEAVPWLDSSAILHYLIRLALQTAPILSLADPESASIK